MKLISALAFTLLLSAVAAVDAAKFDFFDFEGWYEGGFLSVAADPRPTGATVGLNMLLKCEEGAGFNGNSCDWFIRGPSGFSLCDDVVVPGSGVVFEGKIAEYQFNADTGVAEFNINKITCDGEELTSFAVGPPQVPRVPLPPATPVMLEMIPGASNKHVKSLKFTIAGDADDVVIENNFYKLGGGFKES